MDIRKILANNIYVLRNKYKLTQQEFSDRLKNKYTRGHISKIETAANIPSAEFIKLVSETFDVSADWLLSTKGHKSNLESLTEAELELVFKFRSLPEDVQKQLINLINSIIANK